MFNSKAVVIDRYSKLTSRDKGPYTKTSGRFNIKDNTGESYRSFLQILIKRQRISIVWTFQISFLEISVVNYVHHSSVLRKCGAPVQVYRASRVGELFSIFHPAHHTERHIRVLAHKSKLQQRWDNSRKCEDCFPSVRFLSVAAKSWRAIYNTAFGRLLY